MSLIVARNTLQLLAISTVQTAERMIACVQVTRRLTIGIGPSAIGQALLIGQTRLLPRSRVLGRRKIVGKMFCTCLYWTVSYSSN